MESHHYLDLSWYAIHPIELLYAFMGTGCETVTRVVTPDTDVIVGKWKDGRLGTVRANRRSSDYGVIVMRPKTAEVIHPKDAGGYRPMLVEVVKFFQTGTPPVPNDETLELIAFMDAAQKSKEQGGVPVALH